MYFKMKIWNREWVLNLVLRLLSFESRKMFSRSETGLSWNMNPAVVHTLLYLFTSRQQKHLDVHPNSNWLQRVLVVFSMLQWRSLNAVGTFGPQAITRILREIKARMKLRRSTVCSGVKRRNIWIKLYLFLLLLFLQKVFFFFLFYSSWAALWLAERAHLFTGLYQTSPIRAKCPQLLSVLSSSQIWSSKLGFILYCFVKSSQLIND